LKFTGDGFIAYIDYPAFTVQADTAISLGKALVYHLVNCINPAITANGLTELSIRVGIEFGLARAKTFSVQATGKSQTDFISDALNFAVKIQESCEVNEVRLGQCLRDLLHESHLKQLTQVNYDSSDTGEDDYRVYSLH
jgi:class 3 adenylate cyclase